MTENELIIKLILILIHLCLNINNKDQGDFFILIIILLFLKFVELPLFEHTHRMLTKLNRL